MSSPRTRPIVYIASPYTKGDVAMNTHFQCMVFNRLMDDGRVIPVAPLWSHFQHTIFPRPYEDWVAYDQSLLHLYDCCLRLTASNPAVGYVQHESTGADAEVEAFKKYGRPIFYSIESLLEWVETPEAAP